MEVRATGHGGYSKLPLFVKGIFMGPLETPLQFLGSLTYGSLVSEEVCFCSSR